MLRGLGISTICAGLFFLQACTYTYPVVQYNAETYPAESIGVFIVLNENVPTADQPKTSNAAAAAFGAIGAVVEASRYRNAEQASAALADSLSSIQYDPVTALFQSLSQELALVGIETRFVNDSVQRTRHVGLSKTRLEYAGDVDGLNAILDLNFVNWGFCSVIDQHTLRPYLFFNANLMSTDGKQYYMQEVIQFNDIDFKGIKTSMIIGDQNQTFDTIDELIANPELAAQYLDATWEQVAKDLAIRLKQSN